jgi:hypothetical protein
MTDNKVTPQNVVDQMLQLRERRSALKKEFEQQDSKLKEMYTRGENWLLKHLQDTGHKSFKVDGATVFTKVNQRFGIGDWPAFSAWVQETGNIDLLGKRVSSTNMDQYIKESDGEMPPGIKQDAVTSVNIRKA